MSGNIFPAESTTNTDCIGARRVPESLWILHKIDKFDSLARSPNMISSYSTSNNNGSSGGGGGDVGGGGGCGGGGDGGGGSVGCGGGGGNIRNGTVK